jgi:hypothetical protein
MTDGFAQDYGRIRPGLRMKVSGIQADVMTTPTTVIAIDWSGRVDVAGQRRHIVAAVWQAGRVRVESGRTRDEVAAWLIGLARKDPALVVGFDFCFSFPAWFLRELGAESALEFWKVVAEHGERWLSRESEDRRFWGKPHKRPAEFSGLQLHRMLRATDIDCKLAAHIPEEERALRVKGITPKSVFQIGGSGSVGTASLRGMQTLERLHEAGFRVWPFDRPVAGKPLVVEMYSRLNTGPVHKSNAEARAAYLLRKRQSNSEYAAIGRAAMTKARAGEDAFDALVSCMVMAEHREGFYALPVPRDPAYALEGWTWAPPVSE